MTLFADQAGERLDAFVARAAEGLTRSAAQRLIEEGCVLRNGKPGKKNDKLNIGDIIFLRRNANDLYHSLFVSSINNGEIFVASHTIDSFDRNLFSYHLNNPIYFHIEGVKVY
mgnify:CR=1 FL=1